MSINTEKLKKGECLYTIYKTRSQYGNVLWNDWKAVASYERASDVRTFLKIKKVLARYQGCTHYYTETDSMGCFDIYKVDAHINLEESDSK